MLQCLRSPLDQGRQSEGWLPQGALIAPSRQQWTLSGLHKACGGGLSLQWGQRMSLGHSDTRGWCSSESLWEG